MFRPFKRQLVLERKHMEMRLNGLYRAITTDMESTERRMMAKLEDIDASLNLIATELARHADDPPAKIPEHRH